ncbi:MAG: methionine adenosyltransferase [Planctomycetota bacterium]|nr:methionine adenosyltransferase [Planctomycetota bacterium]
MHPDRFTFASECVTMGHPDKVADQISDAILDAILREDRRGRVACETLVTEGMVFVSGEISTTCWVDMRQIIREVVTKIGYDYDHSFHPESIAVFNAIHEQSGDIAQGVISDKVEDITAGDQGMMFGYATDETENYMPAPISYARNIVNRMHELRQNGTLEWMRPDGKSQITVEYRDSKPYRIREVLISTQHAADIERDEIKRELRKHIIDVALPQDLLKGFTDDNFLVNPTGKFVHGGPAADTGLTGRKIIVDTYGGMGRHGGGCFSGKDPSKVDRSGAYAARYIAKNIVAAGLARRCEVQLSYAIGLSEPRAVFLSTFGTGEVDESRLTKAVRDIFPLKVGRILTYFDLLRPIYLTTAKHGHFGIEHYPWEQLDKVVQLKSFFE